MSADKSWKGDVAEEMFVITPKQSSMCGVNFIVGQKWLVYATDYKNEDLPSRAEMCSGTKKLERASYDLTALGQGTKPKTTLPNPARFLFIGVATLIATFAIFVMLLKNASKNRFSMK